MFKKERFFEQLSNDEKNLLRDLEPVVALYVRNMMSKAEYETVLQEKLDDDMYFDLTSGQSFEGLSALAYFECLIRNHSKLPEGSQASEENDWQTPLVRREPVIVKTDIDYTQYQVQCITLPEQLDQLLPDTTLVIYPYTKIIKIPFWEKMLSKCPELVVIVVRPSASFTIKGKLISMCEERGIKIVFSKQ